MHALLYLQVLDTVIVITLTMCKGCAFYICVQYVYTHVCAHTLYIPIVG